MEDTLIRNFIEGKNSTRRDIEEALFDICDSVHASCDSTCPIYRLRIKDGIDRNQECPFFKSGQAMLKELEKRKGEW